MLKKSLVALTAISLLTFSTLVATETQTHWDDGYRIFQDQSPNFVHVEILNVTVLPNKALWFASSSDRVEVEARILKVVRSKDDLRPGMIIPIIYNRKAAAGGTFAETPGIPEKGAILPAFIKRKGDYFIPAARHHTFSPLTKEQLMKMNQQDVALSEAEISALRLPDDLSASFRTNSASGLPLVSPEPPTLKAEAIQREKTKTASLPLTGEISSERANSSVPEATKTAGTTPETNHAMAAKPLAKPEAMPEPSPTESTPETTLSEGPVIDTHAKIRTTSRRTVVVIPPTVLRARRETASQTGQQSRLPLPAPGKSASTGTTPTAPTSSSPPGEVTLVSREPAINILPEPAENSPAATTTNIEPLRAKPVETPPDSTSKLSPIPATTPSPTAPPGASSSDNLEEPIMITDFTPKPVSNVTPNPTASTQGLSETDRENMKSYADIYVSLQKADAATNDEDFATARNLYQIALHDLQTLKATYPDFQPFMVEYRIRDTARKLEQIVLKAPSESKAPAQKNTP